MIVNAIFTSCINYWHLFLYQWKEDIHSYYTLVVNLGLYDLSENMFGKKMFRRTRDKHITASYVKECVAHAP